MMATAYSYRADPNVGAFDDSKPIIVFDGHCNLCSSWANLVIHHDHEKSLRLLAAQSPLGEALYAHYGLKPDDYATNLFLKNGRVRVKSDGTLAMFSALGWPWKALSVLRIFPRAWRDWGYAVIARNRLDWFGRRAVCYRPDPDDADRFL